MSPGEQYRQILDRGEADPDPAQALAVEQFERIHAELESADDSRDTGLLTRVGRRFGFNSRTAVSGLYLWGGVGRGKTWLMDLFFDNLPTDEKDRVHFHRYMRTVHQALRELQDVENPLQVIGERQAKNSRVLCFDEFIVEDIGDAMILSGLLAALFSNGVTLVATSNSAPEDLYRDGLQRDRFKPAIELINQNTTVMKMDDGIDYRLRALDQAETFLVPLGDDADRQLFQSFSAIAVEAPSADGSIDILGRPIEYRYRGDGVVWFDFDKICGGPRSSADYLEITREHHTVIVSNIPVLDRTRDDAARRFIEMIDIFYDGKINFIASADSEPVELYTGSRLLRPFERTVSRLIEMQSNDYLAHKP